MSNAQSKVDDSSDSRNQRALARHRVTPTPTELLNGPCARCRSAMSAGQWRAATEPRDGAKWREEVPLAWKQRRENAAWRKRVATAKRKLKRAMADFEHTIKYIESEYGVQVMACGEDGEFDYKVDDYAPPHTPTYRAKSGAPPEPQAWPSVRFEGSSLSFRRLPDPSDPQPTERES